MPHATIVVLAFAALGGLAPSSAHAQTAPNTSAANEPATPLGEITNSATRTPRHVDDVPATV